MISVLIISIAFVSDVRSQTNDDCVNAILLEAGEACVIREYSNVNATAELRSITPDPSCGSFAGADVWFKLVMPPSGALRVEVDNPLSATPPSFTVYSGSCGNFQELSCARTDPDKTFFDPLLGGQLLYVRVYSYFSNQGRPFTLCIYEPDIPPNNQCENATLLNVEQTCSSQTYTNEYATEEPDVVAPDPRCGYYHGGDIWFKVIMPASGLLRINKTRLSGATHPAMVAYAGSCGAFTEVLCSLNDDTETIDDPSLAGQMLYLRFYRFNSEEGASFELCLYEQDSPLNDNCDDAINIPIGTTCSLANYSNIHATSESADIAPTPPCNDFKGGDVWFKLIMPQSGALEISAVSVAGAVPPSITLYSGECKNFDEVACMSNDKVLVIYDTALAGKNLYLRVYSFNDDNGGNFSLCVFDPGCIEAVDRGEISLCKNESYSFGSQTIKEPGTYSEVFKSDMGCDSLVSISVVFHDIDTMLVNDGTTLTANATGAVYQWIDCSRGNLALPGANGQSFQPDSSGEFAVVISQNSCADTSACYQVSVVVGISTEQSREYYVFPNPAGDLLNVYLPRAYSLISLELIDMTGRTIKTQQFDQQVCAELDTDELPSGKYLLRIQTDEEIVIFNMLKE